MAIIKLINNEFHTGKKEAVDLGREAVAKTLSKPAKEAEPEKGKPGPKPKG